MVKIKDSIITRSQFPNVVFHMFRYIFRQHSAVFLQKLNTQAELFELYSCIFICFRFASEFFEEIPNVAPSICLFVEFDSIFHQISPYQFPQQHDSINAITLSIRSCIFSFDLTILHEKPFRSCQFFNESVQFLVLAEQSHVCLFCLDLDHCIAVRDHDPDKSVPRYV